MLNKITCKNCGANEFTVYGKILKCDYCKTCYATDNVGDYEYFLKAMGFNIEKGVNNIIITHPDCEYFWLQCVGGLEEWDFFDALRMSGKETVYHEGIKLC